MKWNEFRAWLETEKKISHRGTSDVLSRVRRVLTILNATSIDADSYAKLLEHDNYKTLSVTIRSQMKRSIALYLEFLRP